MNQIGATSDDLPRHAEVAAFAHVGAILDLGPGFDETRKKMIPDGFHTRASFWVCLEPEQARGDDVEYRWFAQLALAALGGRFGCGRLH